ncbi:substrate-binding domain-containing protein [Sinomonas sp. P10A9]|uniref:Substrate-binding domain-containing protein n=1 Tax=Sinomonas puerhi TaxID=3238584 RepID=A0AB39LAC3_9MICC
MYNRHAAGLRRKGSKTLGLVVTDIRNPYFADLAMGVEEAAADAGYTLLVGYSRDDVEQQNKHLATMVEQQAEGIVLLPAIGSEKEQLSRIVDRGKVPVVQLARSISPEFGYVGADNRQAARLIAEHVAALGASAAVLIGGPAGSSAREDRLAGLAEGFAGTPVRFDPSQAVPSRNNPHDGADAFASAVDRGTVPEVVLAYSDAVAIGIYARLRRLGLEPGRDVAVASFDDVPLAELLQPPLTSVATHPRQVGRDAGLSLLDSIATGVPPAPSPPLATSLRIRASTASWRTSIRH